MERTKKYNTLPKGTNHVNLRTPAELMKALVSGERHAAEQPDGDPTYRVQGSKVSITTTPHLVAVACRLDQLTGGAFSYRAERGDAHVPAAVAELHAGAREGRRRLPRYGNPSLRRYGNAGLALSVRA
jgi:hypothetical protein